MHGFELVRELTLETLGGKARHFRHVKTGAELISITNDDNNKTFCIAFATPCNELTQSKGLQHILEHCVLCGSKKYPLKDPFAQLIKSSLNTHLNAYTGPIATTYPVSSENLKDFYNLVDVYLDTVFNPLLTAETFETQGWSYKAESADGPFSYSGVVFNEMKGVASQTGRIHHHEMKKELFKGTILQYDQGGIPEEILNLTHKELVEFHSNHYQPSNARIYFSGNDPEDLRLEILNNYLDKFEVAESFSPTVVLPSVGGQRVSEGRLPVGVDAELEREGVVTLNWGLGPSDCPKRILAMHFLSHILLGHNGSPLRLALKECGLGRDVFGAGFAGHLPLAYFTVGLQGVNWNDWQKIQNLILEKLTTIAKDGIEPSLVETSLNQLEYDQVEDLLSAHRGMSLMWRVFGAWYSKRDPMTAINFAEDVKHLKQELAKDSRYLEKLIEKYLLNNQDRVTLVLKPDKDLKSELQRAEDASIQQAVDSFDAAKKLEIYQRAKDLESFRASPESPENIQKIPVLSKSDIPMEQRLAKSLDIEDQGVLWKRYDLPIHDIAYLDLTFDISNFDSKEIPLLPLFTRTLTACGTKRQNPSQFAERITREVGAMSTQAWFAPPFAKEEVRGFFSIRGKVFVDRIDKLSVLVSELLHEVVFDRQARVVQLVEESILGIERGIESGGNGVAIRRARQHIRPSSVLTEKMFGIEQLFFLRNLLTKTKEDWPTVCARLEGIREKILHSKPFAIGLVAREKYWSSIERSIDPVLKQLPAAHSKERQRQTVKTGTWEGLVIPTHVNYVGQVLDLRSLGYQNHGSMFALIKLISSDYLWREIRLQGGAYGCGMGYDSDSLVASFSSYRDPNINRTIEVFQNAPRFIRSHKLDQNELERIVIGAISDYDPIMSPVNFGAAAYSAFLTERSAEDIQRMRTQLLETTPQQLYEAADVLEKAFQNSQVAVVGGISALEKANSESPGRFSLTNVL